MTLRLDWCSHAAAKYAVEHWHYSRCMPRTRVVHVGVWEREKYIGCVLFSRGANNNMAHPFGLTQFQAAELVRIALDTHESSVTRIVSIAVSMLKRQSPGIRLLFSYADPEQGHEGKIYQAGNWFYMGMTTPAVEHIVNGRRMHGRAVRATYGTSIGFEKVMGSSKHRYLMPLDAAMRQQIEPLRKPYPKRATSILADAPVVQTGEDGSTPIVALHTTENSHAL